MAKRENSAKINRLQRCEDILNTELRELPFLPDDQKDPILKVIQFLQIRCNALSGIDDDAEANS